MNNPLGKILWKTIKLGKTDVSPWVWEYTISVDVMICNPIEFHLTPDNVMNNRIEKSVAKKLIDTHPFPPPDTLSLTVAIPSKWGALSPVNDHQSHKVVLFVDLSEKEEEMEDWLVFHPAFVV